MGEAGRAEPAVTAGRGPAGGAAFQQHHVGGRVPLLGQQRGPQAGEPRADHGQVGGGGLAQRRGRPPGRPGGPARSRPAGRPGERPPPGPGHALTPRITGLNIASYRGLQLAAHVRVVVQPLVVRGGGPDQLAGGHLVQQLPAAAAGLGRVPGDDRLGGGDGADVVDRLGELGGDLRLVVPVHQHHRVHRVLRVLGDHHVVGPQRAALVRDDELQVRPRAQVLLEDVPGPGHRDPGVPAGQLVDVGLPVVAADQARVALLGQRLRRRLPVRRGGCLRVDAQLEQAEVAQVLDVGHHPDPALVGRVPQLLEAGHRGLDELRVPRDAGGAGRPRDAVGVPRVERAVLELGRRVLVEVRQQALVQRDQLAAGEQLGEPEPVGDHHQVVADRLARAWMIGLILLTQYGAFLDDLGVADRDPGGRGELLQRLVAGVDVQRPVGEVHVPVPLLGRPEPGHRVLRMHQRAGGSALPPPLHAASASPAAARPPRPSTSRRRGWVSPRASTGSPCRSSHQLIAHRQVRSASWLPRCWSARTGYRPRRWRCRTRRPAAGCRSGSPRTPRPGTGPRIR